VATAFPSSVMRKKPDFGEFAHFAILFFTLSEIIKSCFFLITSKYEVLAISLCYTILFLLIRRREWIRLHVATAFPSSVTRKKHDFAKTQNRWKNFGRRVIKSCFFLITSRYEVLAISICYTILFLLIRRREWIRLHVATAFPSSVMRKKPDFGEFATLILPMWEIIKSCFFLITSKYEVLAISLCYTILFLLIRRREWIRLHVATAFPSSVMRKKPDFGEFFCHSS